MSAPKRNLFGGAITANVPQGFLDASEFRPVPDTQEVFIDDASGTTVIIELLERVSDVPDKEAISFHFNELARANRATDNVVVAVADPVSKDDGVFNQDMFGRQKIAKYNEQGCENDVAVYLGLRRLPPPISTDMVVTVSYAFNIADGSSDGNVERSRKLSPEEVRQLGELVFQSLNVVDYGLFGEPENADDQQQKQS